MTSQFVQPSGTLSEFTLTPTSVDSTVELIVPANHAYRFLYMHMSAVANANVANRSPVIEIRNSANQTTMRCIAMTVTASQTVLNQWGQDQTTSTGLNSTHMWVMPTVLALGRIEFDVANIEAGDVFTLRGVYQDYLIRFPTAF